MHTQLCIYLIILYVLNPVIAQVVEVKMGECHLEFQKPDLGPDMIIEDSEVNCNNKACTYPLPILDSFTLITLYNETQRWDPNKIIDCIKKQLKALHYSRNINITSCEIEDNTGYKGIGLSDYDGVSKCIVLYYINDFDHRWVIQSQDIHETSFNKIVNTFRTNCGR